jgi:hypothetical protein
MKPYPFLTVTLASAAIFAASFEPLKIDLERIEQGTNAVWTFTWPARTLTAIRIEEIGTGEVCARTRPRPS